MTAPDPTAAETGDKPIWWPVPPECCGQCGSGGFAETWHSEPAVDAVLVEFTCPGCGYIVSKYGYPPSLTLYGDPTAAPVQPLRCPACGTTRTVPAPTCPACGFGPTAAVPAPEPDEWAEVLWLPKAAQTAGRASYRVVEEDDGYRVLSNQADGTFS